MSIPEVPPSRVSGRSGQVILGDGQGPASAAGSGLQRNPDLEGMHRPRTRTPKLDPDRVCDQPTTADLLFDQFGAAVRRAVPTAYVRRRRKTARPGPCAPPCPTAPHGRPLLFPRLLRAVGE